MLKKAEIVGLLNEMAFDSDKYWVTSGAAMVIYGIKESTRDIDLGCTTELADKLEAEGYKVIRLDDGSRKIVYSSSVEIFEDWIEGEVEFFEGVPIVSVDGLIKMKEKLGREKDLADIELIKSTNIYRA